MVRQTSEREDYSKEPRTQLDVWDEACNTALTWIQRLTPLDMVLFSICLTANPFCYWKWGFFFVEDWITKVSHPILIHIFLCARSIAVHLSLFFPSWEHNWLRINLMFCRGHPVLWLTARETCNVPCCYSESKSYHPNLMLPVAVNWFSLLMSCSCLPKQRSLTDM